MTRDQAEGFLMARYEDQCNRYPKTSSVPLRLYLQRNLKRVMRMTW